MPGVGNIEVCSDIMSDHKYLQSCLSIESITSETAFRVPVDLLSRQLTDIHPINSPGAVLDFNHPRLTHTSVQ